VIFSADYLEALSLSFSGFLEDIKLAICKSHLRISPAELIDFAMPRPNLLPLQSVIS